MKQKKRFGGKMDTSFIMLLLNALAKEFILFRELLIQVKLFRKLVEHTLNHTKITVHLITPVCLK